MIALLALSLAQGVLAPQADANAAEREALGRAYARLETFRVEYEILPPKGSSNPAARVRGTVDRLRRRAHLEVGDGDAPKHILLEEDVFRVWQVGGPAVRYDLLQASADFRRESGEAEAALRKLLPPAFGVSVDVPSVPVLIIDLVTEGERGGYRLRLGLQSGPGAPSWISRLRGAVATEGAPETANFRFPDQKKNCRIDRATGLIRSLELELEGGVMTATLKDVSTTAEFAVPALPPKFADEPAPVELLHLPLIARSESFRGLLASVRGVWTELQDDARVAPLLRRWCVAYAEALRTQRVRLWMAGSLRDILAQDPEAVPDARIRELAARFHGRLVAQAEQERVPILTALKTLAEDLKPEGEPLKPFDAALQSATSPEAVLRDLPAWTAARVESLLREERARPR